MSSYSVKYITDNSIYNRFSHFEIYCNGKYFSNVKSVEELHSTLIAPKKIIEKINTIRAVNSFDLVIKNFVFLETGFIWNISSKGQRPQIYCPYEVLFSFDDTKVGGIQALFSNVTILSKTRKIDFKDLRDFLIERKQIILTLVGKGKNQLMITTNKKLIESSNFEIVHSLVTSNGGAKLIYLGIS
jgi:hypothetical protein